MKTADGLSPGVLGWYLGCESSVRSTAHRCCRTKRIINARNASFVLKRRIAMTHIFEHKKHVLGELMCIWTYQLYK